MATVSETSNGSRCCAQNRRGERCQRHASEPGGLCIVHAGKLSMSELGKKGGSRSPMTKLRKAADDDLRERARDVLARALAGEDVPKAALDSARSLFSYRADSPPYERHDSGMGAEGSAIRTGVFGLADLVRVTTDRIDLTSMPDLVAACRELVAVADAGGGARVS